MGSRSIRKRAQKVARKSQKVLDDKKINVMLLGNSGAGKSTLINAFLNTRLEKAPTGTGKAVTDEIRVYGDRSGLDFRLIDTPGLEYSRKKQNWLFKELKKWMNESVKNPNPQAIIHTIWFCISGTEKRFPKESIDYLQTISRFWKEVPVIFVCTKTLSDEEAEENAEMIEKELDRFGREKLNIKGVVHVLAEEMAGAQPRGIEELAVLTEQTGPEAKAIFEKNWREKSSRAKRIEAHKVVLSRTATAAAVDAVKSRGGVSRLVEGIQKEMLYQVAALYEIEDDKAVRSIASQLMKTHAVTALGKSLAGKAIPIVKGKLKLAAKATNASISGIITLTLGEIGIIVFENIYKGELDLENTDWDEYVTNVLKDKTFATQLKKIKRALSDRDGDTLIDELLDVLERIRG